MSTGIDVGQAQPDGPPQSAAGAPASGAGLLPGGLPDGLLPGEPTPVRRRRRGRFVAAVLAAVALLVAGAGIASWQAISSVDGKVERFPSPFTGIPEAERPPAVAGDALNILIMGSDSRVSAGDPTKWAAGAQRTDAIMLAHIPADRSGVQVISIPRDSWVQIPGRGMAKINAGFSYGGPALAVRTIESVTGVRIDHIVITDFTGFARITDLVGGVELDGTQMDGATALAYVRERYSLPRGDFDRMVRQQQWLRAILEQATQKADPTNPASVYELASAVASSLSVDDSFSLRDMVSLVVSLRDVHPAAIQMTTAPVRGTGWSPDGKQAIVLLDDAKGAQLWKAVNNDTAGAWIAASGS